MKRKYPALGSMIRIVTPKAFVRCGYPLTYSVLLDKHGSEVYPVVDKLYASLYELPAPVEALPGWTEGPLSVNINASNIFTAKEGRVYQYLISAVCSKMLRDKNWGGRERRIHEEPIDPSRLCCKVWFLEKKRFVKTGDWYGSRGGYDSYFGEYDYEPGGLENEQTHCIYTLSGDGDQLDILSSNCEVAK